MGIHVCKRGTVSSQDGYTNLDAIEQFREAMIDYGLTPPSEIIGDGRKRSFCTGTSLKMKGEYKLFLDERPAGYFKDFKTDLYVNWKYEGEYTPFTPEERRAYAEKCRKQEESRKAETLAEQKSVAKKAVWIWGQCETAPVDHPYLVRKGIEGHGAKLGRNNTLVIPIFNEKFEIVNLQFIAEAGEKRFLKGGRKLGCFCWLGGKQSKKILICEGFATGASLREDTGYLVVLSFDAGNLKGVAQTIRKLKPDVEIIICGDHDTPSDEMIMLGKKHDVGQRDAKEAAFAIMCEYTYPPIPGHDFNDMITLCGLPKGGIFEEYLKRGTLYEHEDAGSSIGMV